MLDPKRKLGRKMNRRMGTRKTDMTDRDREIYRHRAARSLLFVHSLQLTRSTRPALNLFNPCCPEAGLTVQLADESSLFFLYSLMLSGTGKRNITLLLLAKLQRQRLS